MAKPTFIGRQSELGALEAALWGAPSVVLVQGPAGVGKTALAQRFAAGHRMLRAAGEPGESGGAVGVARQLLRRGGKPEAGEDAGARLLELFVAAAPLVVLLDDA